MRIVNRQVTSTRRENARIAIDDRLAFSLLRKESLLQRTKRRTFHRDREISIRCSIKGSGYLNFALQDQHIRTLHRSSNARLSWARYIRDNVTTELRAPGGLHVRLNN